MKLEEQVVSLDLSRKLKELGIKQESYWCWHENVEGGIHVGANAGEYFKRLASAFTVAELFERLPDVIMIEGFKHVLVVGKNEVGYRNSSVSTIPPKFKDGTFADRLAKMLRYLIENGLVKI